MRPSSPSSRAPRSPRSPRSSRRGLLVLAVALVVTAAAGGCSGGSSSSDLGGPDLIVIATISPPEGTKLAPGSSVTFTAGLSYILNSSGAATIMLVIEDQDGRVLNTSSEITTVVSRGTACLQMSDLITIPPSGVSQVKGLFTLGHPPAFAPPSVASASYPVG